MDLKLRYGMQIGMGKHCPIRLIRKLAAYAILVLLALHALMEVLSLQDQLRISTEETERLRNDKQVLMGLPMGAPGTVPDDWELRNLEVRKP